MYFFCIGEIGLSPAEFWKLTEGETIAKITGHHFRNARRSADFRALYSLTYNMNAKRGQQKKPHQLWNLIIDEHTSGRELTHDEIVERNKKIKGL
jgi:hypothetical protein